LAKTFEALRKAEKERLISSEETNVFDLNQTKSKSKARISPSFKATPQIAEEYHRMRQTLLSANTEDKIKTLLFTSSTKGEGTSTILTRFATTLASEDDNVLLVDANLRNPSLHNLLGIEKKRGLSDLLLVNNTLREVIKKTQIKNLSVITSGVPHSTPSSIFESKLLDQLIEQMKSQADWVLFDSPPINVYNDSSTLAAKMDGVIMVVQAEKTRWEVAQSAKEQIENDKVKITGVILNRRQMYIPEWVYKML